MLIKIMNKSLQELRQTESATWKFEPKVFKSVTIFLSLWGAEIRETKTFNLSRNMSKFVAWQVVSLMKNEQQSQHLLLKVDPRCTFRNNFLQPATNIFVGRQVGHGRWKTRNIDPKLTTKQLTLRDKLSVFRRLNVFISLWRSWRNRSTLSFARSNNSLLWWMKLLKLRPQIEGFETAQAAVLHQQFQVISLLCFVPAFSPFVPVHFASSYVSGA